MQIHIKRKGTLRLFGTFMIEYIHMLLMELNRHLKIAVILGSDWFIMCLACSWVQKLVLFVLDLLVSCQFLRQIYYSYSLKHMNISSNFQNTVKIKSVNLKKTQGEEKSGNTAFRIFWDKALQPFKNNSLLLF